MSPFQINANALCTSVNVCIALMKLSQSTLRNGKTCCIHRCVLIFVIVSTFSALHNPVATAKMHQCFVCTCVCACVCRFTKK